ncbi:MAG: hypothetical protein ABJA94_05885 [Rhodoglobus sp.]
MHHLAMLAGRVIVWIADPSPSPSAPPDDLVTPGVVGFGLTFFVAAATILLIIDMSRRMRRVRYRAEIREQLEAERRADAASASKRPKPKNG